LKSHQGSKRNGLSRYDYRAGNKGTGDKRPEALEKRKRAALFFFLHKHSTQSKTATAPGQSR